GQRIGLIVDVEIRLVRWGAGDVLVRRLEGERGRGRARGRGDGGARRHHGQNSRRIALPHERPRAVVEAEAVTVYASRQRGGGVLIHHAAAIAGALRLHRVGDAIDVDHGQRRRLVGWRRIARPIRDLAAHQHLGSYVEAVHGEREDLRTAEHFAVVRELNPPPRRSGEDETEAVHPNRQAGNGVLVHGPRASPVRPGGSHRLLLAVDEDVVDLRRV